MHSTSQGGVWVALPHGIGLKGLSRRGLFEVPGLRQALQVGIRLLGEPWALMHTQRDGEWRSLERTRLLQRAEVPGLVHTEVLGSCSDSPWLHGLLVVQQSRFLFSLDIAVGIVPIAQFIFGLGHPHLGSFLLRLGPAFLHLLQFLLRPSSAIIVSFAAQGIVMSLYASGAASVDWRHRLQRHEPL